MSFFLHTKNLHAVADFMESVLEFLPASGRQPYQEMIGHIREHQYPPREKTIPLAYQIGRTTWPARRALNRYLETSDGAQEEWNRLFERCRAKTAAALKKLKSSANSPSLEHALDQSDASLLIDSDMELELSLLRPQIRLMLWQEHQKALVPFLKEAEQELQDIDTRLQQMKEEAARSRTGREFIQAKILAFEDRIYFGGESLPIDMLDSELQFEREEREMPTVE
jgi:hypothetical protein